MALTTSKTRSISASFYVYNENVKVLVKTTTININQNAVSSIVEQVTDPENYAKNRAELRKDEAKLSEMRYAIEDEIIAELEAEEKVEDTE